MDWDDESAEHFYATIDRRPRVGLIIATAAATSVAVVVALYLALPAAAGARKVPALVGLPLEKAVRAAQEAGLRLVVSGAAPDGLVDRGAVSRQAPLAGSAVTQGARVAVVLSEGRVRARGPAQQPPAADTGSAAAAPTAVAGEVVVPRLIGASLARARQLLADAGLRAGPVRYAADEDRVDGTVLRHAPEPGERVRRGAAVELVVNETDSR